jgi:putative DNA primase/helicase
MALIKTDKKAILDACKKERRITDKEAKDLGLYVVSSIEAREHKFKYTAAGVVLPFHNPEDGAPHPKLKRIRYAKPEPEGVRYSQPAKSGVEVYCASLPDHINWPKVLEDADVPLVVTEGEFKAIAAIKCGIPCVGLGGVGSFGRMFLTPYLKRFKWTGRVVYITYDSDVHDKAEVAVQERKLAQALKQKGATVLVVPVPDPADGSDKQGLDDWLWAQGGGKKAKAAYLRLVAGTAQEPVPPAQREGLLTAHVASILVKELRYVHDTDIILCLQNSVWMEDKTKKAWGRVNELCEDLAKQPNAEADARWLERASTARAVESKLKGLQELGLTASQLDTSPCLTGLPDGSLLDLSKEGVEHYLVKSGTAVVNPAAYVTRCLAVAPEKSKPTLWLKCLGEWFPGKEGKEVVAFIQRAFGYTLTGLINEEHFFFVKGLSGSGKSKLMGPLFDILKTYAYAIPEDLVVYRGEKHEPNAEHLSGLEGPRLASYSESNRGAKLNAGLIKKLTGGDAMPARALYKKSRTVRPGCKLWIMSNFPLEVRGEDSEGMRRRLLVVQMDEVVEEDKIDTTISERLRAEYPRILYWMLEGLHDYYKKKGLAAPDAIKRWSRAYLDDQDKIMDWFKERVEEAADTPVRLDALGENYRAWDKAQGGTGNTQNKTLGSWFRARGYKTKPGAQNKTYVQGLRLTMEMKQAKFAAQQEKGKLLAMKR